MGANYLEAQENKWVREIGLGIIVALTLFFFIAQL
jgi:hypothetical protein